MQIAENNSLTKFALPIKLKFDAPEFKEKFENDELSADDTVL